jgi:Ca2+-binding RTX toxin-like protein/subtilisin-like proprotein convertase family protein
MSATAITATTTGSFSPTEDFRPWMAYDSATGTAITGAAGDYGLQPIWDEGLRGQGVKVGVNDTGLVMGHADFDYGKVDAGSYLITVDEAATGSNWHGTAVASVIAASANGLGQVGIAPEASLWTTGPLAISFVADALAAGVDVVNNSWGWTWGPAGLSARATMDAEFDLAALGRGGLGMSLVFAAGNARGNRDDTSLSTTTNHENVIAVAAVRIDTTVTSFSTPGEAVHVAALGQNNIMAYALDPASDWLIYASGTSFAAPFVTGVVALMYQANPGLGLRDVQDILAYSARLPASTASFGYNGSALANGGGLHYSRDYGFGLVNAHDAVRLAQTWLAGDTAAHTGNNRAYVTAAGGVADLALPADGEGAVSLSFNVAEHGDVEHVRVALDLVDTDFDDLKITLVSPDGTSSLVMDRYFNVTNGQTQTWDGVFDLASRRFWGEDSSGTWTLTIQRVQDADGSVSTGGLLRSATLVLSTDPETLNDRYVYTDEFNTLATADPTRRTLADTDGGTDTFNAAAVTAAAIVRLDLGTFSFGGGSQGTIAAGTQIELVITGDGSDTLTGNAAGNGLDGGAGNDSLAGGAGADSLTGGTGADVLSGGTGFDLYLFEGAYGLDLIDEQGDAADTDTVRYGSGIDPVTVTVSRDGFDLKLAEGGNLLTVNHHFGGAAFAIEQAEFADGTVWSDGTLRQMVNLAPTVQAALADIEILEDSPFDLSVANAFADADSLIGDSLSYAALLASGDPLPDWLTFLSFDALFGGTPDDADLGTFTIKITATDQFGASVFDLFDLSVRNVNDAPTGDVTVTGLFSLGETLWAGHTLADADGLGAVGYQWQRSSDGGAAWVDIAGATGESYLLAAADLGVRIRVVAHYIDGHGTPESVASVAGENLVVTVAGLPPVVAQSLADQWAAEGAAFSFEIPAGSFIDPDGDPLSYAAGLANGDPLPAWLTFDAAGRRFDGTPPDAAAGLLAVRVTATDPGGAGAADEFVIDIANLVTGTAGDDSLAGTALRDIVDGLDGNDTVRGGAGNDSLDGGAGTDLLDLSEATAALSFALAQGAAATVADLAAVGLGVDSYRNVEGVIGSAYNDSLAGSGGNDVLQGGAGNDSLTGDAGNDTLEGGTGNDTLNGGTGTDTASYASATAGVTVSLALATAQNTIGAGTDLLSGLENLAGSAFNDKLTGSSGNNVLEGGLGNDTLNGGTGLDTASYATAGAGVTVSLALTGAQDTFGAGVDTLAALENLAGSAHADTLIGNTAANTLEGGAGHDSLDGGSGNDLLDGGAGDDSLNGGLGLDTASYASAGAGVTVSLALAGAQDTGGAGLDTLAAIENLTGSAYADTLTGNTAANTLAGGAGHDSLSGGDGADFLEGGTGDDVLNGGNGADTASYATAGAGVTASLVLAGAQDTGGAGLDTLVAIENLTGSAYADSLTGNAAANTLLGGNGADSLDGGAGNDFLRGGAGADSLTGGLGADRFDYDALLDSLVGSPDLILDFVAAQGDKLDLSTLDANLTLAGNQAFGFVGDAAFSAAGQVRYDTGTGLVQVNVDATLGADLEIQLVGVASLAATNFVL